jgi:hypothetical protein
MTKAIMADNGGKFGFVILEFLSVKKEQVLLDYFV